MQYTAADVQNILTAFAEEFLVDVPAYHSPAGEYLIEHDTLVRELTLNDPEWYAAIAGFANETPEPVLDWALDALFPTVGE